MTRHKKAARGRGGGTPKGGRGRGKASNGHAGLGSNNAGWDTDEDLAFVPFSGSMAPRPINTNAFTLQKEAFNTQRHQASWNPDGRLRDTKVNFVSASASEDPAHLIPDETAAMADMTLQETVNNVGSTKETSNNSSKESSQPADVEGAEPSFFIDTDGNQPIETGLPPPVIRASSPTPSSSGDDILLFAGRDSNGRGIIRSPPNIKAPSTRSRNVRTVEDKINLQSEAVPSASGSFNQPLNDAEKAVHINASSSQGPIAEETESLAPKPKSRHNKRSRGFEKETSEDDALIADYIANLEEQGFDPAMPFGQRTLGGFDDVWNGAEDSSESPGKDESPEKDAADDWNRSDLSDFNNLSTSDGVLGIVQAVLSKRTRPSGLQYLVVWENQTVDEARWIHTDNLTNPHATSLIAKFEAEEKVLADLYADADDSDSDDDMLDIENDANDSDDEDDAAIEALKQSIDKMADAEIARLLAKQEELGMGSDELMIFDGLTGAPDNEDSFMPRPSRRMKPASKRPQGEIPAASLLADAYDGFDVMDFERPSLKRKPKGRRGKLPFDISDSELELSRQAAWDNDRMKKKERKEERESLRLQGLLGRNGKKPDLKAKYKEGMGIHAVKDEIKMFLMGGNTTLALPPMEKADRKCVHELAVAFRLKSKSVGKGELRFPVLYRTRQTLTFATESEFTAIETQITRRFLPRMDLKRASRTGTPRRTGGSGGGGSSTAASYRDGDIVGASAPQLGVENKGRAMLEKMGWSMGTALGALNNKGILEPVSHVVKTSKAGLG